MSLEEQKIEESPWRRLADFLRTELAFYPGRMSLIVRIVSACTITMGLIMVFRMPGAALGAYYPILLSRESPRATLKAAVRTSWVCTLGTAELLLGAMLLIANPFTHLFWVFGNLLLVFFLISALEAYDAAIAFGFMVTVAISIWDLPLSADARLTRMLFALLSIVMGCAVSVLVEYIFTQTHSRDPILEGIRDRMSVAGAVLQDVAGGVEIEHPVKATLLRTARRGTGELRERLAHSAYQATYKDQLATAVALSGRLVELTAQLARTVSEISARDRDFCGAVAENIESIHMRLGENQSPEWPDVFEDGEYRVHPLVVELERTVELIAESFNSDLDEAAHGHRLPEPGEQLQLELFVPDAFTNRDHLKFAVRGTLSAMACYLFYMSVGWNALGAAVVTCVLTALPVTGAGRHKQLMRFSGVLIGACVLGVLSQVIILPQIDGIQAFALLFAGVVAVGAWLGTSSPRLAYAGAQIVLAYDLVNLNSFAVNPSLVPARDAILGILLGSAAMWFIFDRLWTTPTVDAMRSLLLMSLRDTAAFDIDRNAASVAEAEGRLWRESERLTRKFDELRTLVDFAAFEAKPDSEEEILLAELIVALQPQLRAVTMVKSGLLHHQIVAATDVYRNLVVQVEEIAKLELLEAAALLENVARGPRAFITASEEQLRKQIDQQLLQAWNNQETEPLTELRLCSSLLELSLNLRESFYRATETEQARITRNQAALLIGLDSGKQSLVNQ